jgi:hypothetical protein
MLNGTERTLLVNRKPRVRAVRNLEAALKRQFGPPREPKEHKQMDDSELKQQSGVQTMPEDLASFVDDMLNTDMQSVLPAIDLTPHALVLEHEPEPIQDTPADTPAKTWPVSIGAYRSQDHTRQRFFTQLNFYFPLEIMTRFPDGMAVERLDDESWKIYPVPGSGRNVLHFRQQGKRKARMSYTDDGVEPFQMVDGEAVEADNSLLVYLPMAKREEVARPRTAPQPAPAPVKSALPMPPTERMTDLEEQMREITNRVRVIEAMCPYRLVRLEGGRILWRAPIIE